MNEAEVRRLFDLARDMIPPDLAAAQDTALKLLNEAQKEIIQLRSDLEFYREPEQE